MQVHDSAEHDAGRRRFVTALGTAGAGLWVPIVAAAEGGGNGSGQRTGKSQRKKRYRRPRT
jgi:hypothetical protein